MEKNPEDDPLDDFERRSITLHGETKVVYVAGTGPAVIVMAEMPGISPHVARFSRWVRDAGFTVYMPSLFGRDGAFPDAEEGKAVIQRACVSAEFRAFAANESSPVTQWLRALASLAHEQCGGPGVGAIGMCFTGNFALTMMLEPAMLAPVLCQPSLPLNDPAGLERGIVKSCGSRRRAVQSRPLLAGAEPPGSHGLLSRTAPDEQSDAARCWPFPSHFQPICPLPSIAAGSDVCSPSW
jgi:dienelactone hydrolase